MLAIYGAMKYRPEFVYACKAPSNTAYRVPLIAVLGEGYRRFFETHTFPRHRVIVD